MQFRQSRSNLGVVQKASLKTVRLAFLLGFLFLATAAQPQGLTSFVSGSKSDDNLPI
jgi:hypothetical protein